MRAENGTVFFLAGLGLGAAAAEPLRSALDGRWRVVGIDLPGQGQAPDAANGSVAQLADAALAAIEAEADGGSWLLVAHSMGGKVAALVIDRVLSGRASVYGLAGAVLLAPSPPTPEPMDDAKRDLLASWAEQGPISEVDARQFIASNVATPLDEVAEWSVVAQIRATSPLSWQRWLAEGSREDISALVGVIDLPVVVIAGEDDDDLGSAAQPQLLGSVYPRARFLSLASTGHLIPYEQATQVASEVIRLWEATAEASPPVPAEWGRLIASDRTDARTRSFMAQRAIIDDTQYAPRALSPAQLATLRSLANRLVPQPDAHRIDLAARVDADLAAGRSDGWRPAQLPDDTSAYRLGLDAIATVWKDDDVGQQEALITAIINGEPIPYTRWSGDLLRRWFEDMRTDLIRTWAAHPASLVRIGYDGFATSGPAVVEGATGEHARAGYVSLAAGLRDGWEPVELGQEKPE